MRKCFEISAIAEMVKWLTGTDCEQAPMVIWGNRNRSFDWALVGWHWLRQCERSHGYAARGVYPMSYVLDEEAAEVTEFGALACFPIRLVPDRKRPRLLRRGLNRSGVQCRFGLLMHWAVTVNLDPPLRNALITSA
jgi:hypothetical protein